MEPINFGYILETLRNQQCLFILGPDFPRLENQLGLSLRESFHQSVNQDSSRKPYLAYYEKEELYLFENGPSQTSYYYQLKNYYQQAFWKKPYEQIMRFPTKLILNASPDIYLRDIYQEDNASFSFFHKARPQGEVPEFSVNRPLIYNLMGSIEEEESLLLTHDDLFKYLEIVFSEGKVPQSILNTLFEARCLIFLGVKFDKWYVQLLLRQLKIHDRDAKFMRYAVENDLGVDTLSICSDQFQIKFINGDIYAFLDDLYKRCEQENILLEQGGKSSGSLRARINDFVSQDRLRDALDLMEGYFKEADPEINLEIVPIRGRLTRLERRKLKNLITEEQAIHQYALVQETILELSEEIIEA